MEGWGERRRGLKTENAYKGRGKTDLTLTGLLMEGLDPRGDKLVRMSSKERLSMLSLLLFSSPLLAPGVFFVPQLAVPGGYVNATQYGVRAANASAMPASSGMTGSITSGTNRLTVSTANCPGQSGSVCFQNGNGISVYGAGAPHRVGAPAAPTVTPTNARTLTGVGDDVASPSGSSTYNYVIVAQSFGGGFSAPSSKGSTSTGHSTIGSNSAIISSMSRSNNTVTVTTPGPTTISSGTMVIIDGASDPTFNGMYQATSGSTGTSFTFRQGLDTRNGASTNAVGGRVFWFSNNLVAWKQGTGPTPFRYYICSDRASPGTYHIVGISKPNNPAGGYFTDGTLYWEDYGATMRGNLTAISPNASDAICAGSATADTLTTSIKSGAGTTTLTLASNAGTSVTNAQVRIDSATGILAAVAANGYNAIRFPPGDGTYPINSVLDLHSLNASLTGANLTVNETVILPSANWKGIVFPGGGSADAFQFESLPAINCNITPCIYVLNGGGGRLEGMKFWLPSNNSIGLLSDGGGGGSGVTFERLNFTMGSNPYMSEGLELRGASNSSSSGACNMMRQVLFLGAQFAIGQTATPIYYGNRGGCATVESAFLNGAGTMLRYDTPGGSITQQWGYRQGGYMPVVTTTAIKESSGNTGAKLEIRNFVQDTDPLCLVNYLPSQSTLSIGVIIKTAVLPASSHNQTCGNPIAMLQVDAGPSRQTGQNTDINGLISEGSEILASGTTPGTGIGMQMQVPAAPAVALASGGSLAVGSYIYQIIAYDTNGNATTPSAASKACTTSGGNRTCSLSWSLVPGQVATTVCRSNACAVIGAGFKIAGTTFFDTGHFFPSGSPPTVNQAIASGDTSTGLVTTQIALIANGFSGKLVPLFTADRTIVMPDANSHLMVVGTLTTTSAASDTLTLQGVTSSSHCTFSAANASAATNIASSYISSVSNNAVTLAHTATSGMIYNFACSKN
jgi:hypothetical protein